jgi:hypothetical protein
MNASGADVSSFGITGLSKETSIDSLNEASDADVEKIFKPLIEALGKNDWGDKLQEQEALRQSTMFNQDMNVNTALMNSSLGSGSAENAEALLDRGEVILA